MSCRPTELSPLYVTRSPSSFLTCIGVDGRGGGVEWNGRRCVNIEVSITAQSSKTGARSLLHVRSEVVSISGYVVLVSFGLCVG